MSTELSNGVIIPEEYSDDWYDEMSINLRKLNDVITAASDNATDIQRLDTDKANQSDLTALTSRVSQNETDITALQTAVSGALKREIVQTLPTEDISTTTIYMIRNSQSSGTNIYDEYMYINSQWELIGTSATDFSNYYTKNETDNLLSGKVDNSTLGSYYTKTESDNLLSAKANQTDLTALGGRVTQTETDITALQTAVSGALKREIVQTLPTQDISTTTIYMIRNTTTSGDNIYDEYMYINNLWELIGTSATDFSNYYTKTEIDTLLSGKADDNSVVHLSGSETVEGNKTWASQQIWNVNCQRRINSTFEKGETPSSNYGRNDYYTVKNGTTSYANALAVLGCLITTENKVSTYFHALKNQAGVSTRTTFEVSYDTNTDKKEITTNADFLPTENSQSVGSSTNKWSEFHGVTYYYGSSNTEFSQKFVTTDTEQTVGGKKQLNAYLTLNGSQMNNEFSNNARTCAYLTANRDTVGKSGVFVSKFRQNRAQGSLSGSDVVQVCFDMFENEVRTNRLWYLNWVDWNNDAPETVEIRSMCNKVDYRLTHINNLVPSSLSLPDINNPVDISSYITDLTGASGVNSYTPPANGWVAVGLRGDFIEMYVPSFVFGGSFNKVDSGVVQGFMPVIANTTMIFAVKGTQILWAKFYPCLGNV